VSFVDQNSEEKWLKAASFFVAPVCY